MAKKKHPKLPNGFGSIKKLSGNRSNPYAVYPPATEHNDETGLLKTPKALCYVSDWYIGFYALMEYKNGTFNAEKFSSPEIKDNDKNYDIVSKIISSYNNTRRVEANELSFSTVYDLFYTDKFDNPNSKKKFSKSSINAYSSAYKRALLYMINP